MSPVEHIARVLAAEHALEDKALGKVFWSPADEEVRLVEVTRGVRDGGELVPLQLPADPPIVPFPAWVLLVSPGDWERIQAGEVLLPDAFRDLRRIR